MGFYLRKSFKVGPIRFNLSKSGLGASVGVTGLRYGVRPDGSTYVHAGRYGIYYRQELRRHNRDRAAVPETATKPTTAFDTLAASSLAERSQNGLSQLLASCYSRPRVDYAVAVLGILASIIAFVVNRPVGAALTAPCIATFVIATRWENRRRHVYVRYDMNDPTSQTFQHLVAGVNELASCRRVWALTSSTPITNLVDFKRNAGASSIVARQAARVGEGGPPWVEVNIPIPAIASRGQTLYFFPHGIIVHDGTGIGFVDYTSVRVLTNQTRFIEDDKPSDATVVGSTWLHPNRDGGPDKRFAQNYQIPICLYDEVVLLSPSGMLAYLQTSRPGVAQRVESALVGAAETVRSAVAKSGSMRILQPSLEVNKEYFQSLPKTLWIGAGGSLVGLARWVDGWLGIMAGQGNNIVHNFLRVLAMAILATIGIVAIYAAVLAIRV